MPLKNGKMGVFLSYPELGWLDLESGENGSWHTSPMFYMAPVKLDEQHLLMDSGALPNRPSLTWRFNIETEVITQVGDGVRKGSLHSLGARAGLPRRGSQPRLGEAVTQHTGSREIKSFQGAYNGSEFTVGEAR